MMLHNVTIPCMLLLLLLMVDNSKYDDHGAAELRRY